jgi:polysaccharide deacetylase family protein (PEP-CTERM system associated)
VGPRECRVERNVQRILALLAERGTQATFFTLGWVAERYPALVRDIVAGGHELASHGYGHERASDLDRAAFRDDIARAKALLEDTGGVAVKGYRAPSFSIGRGNLWALEVLREAGHRYSSSIYPIAHDHYGMPDAPRFAYRTREGLLEVPVTTLRLFEPQPAFQRRRLLPAAALCRVTRWMLRRVNQIEREPAVFYFHPWEIDPRPAAHRRHRRQDALPALRQHRPQRGKLARLLATSVGAAWTTYFSTENAPTAHLALASTA